MPLISVLKTLQDRQFASFVDSSVTAGQPAIAIVNPDGTSIGNVSGVTGSAVGTTGAVAPTSAIEAGGVFNTTQPTYTTGQLGQVQITARGSLISVLADPTTVANQAAVTGAAPSGGAIQGLVVRPYAQTDGTNVMPTMDAAARVGFVRLSDGTNNTTVIAGNAAVSESTLVSLRSAGQVFGYDTSQIAGSQIVPIKAETNNLHVAVFNAANQMPSMDVATRKGFVQLTDGTTSVSVIAGTTALKTDLSSVAGTATSTAAAGILKVGITGNSGASVDAAGQNVVSPANEILVGGQFNTTPTTIVSGNMSPLQLDNAGNLLVKVNAGGSNQNTNLAQIAGTATSVNNGVADAGTLRVTLANNGTGVVRLTDGITNTNVIAATNALKVDTSSVAGTATVTSAAGVQKVGVVGNANAAFDGATNAAPPANAVLQGVVSAAALPTAVTATNTVAPMADKFGRQTVLLNSVRDLTSFQATTITSSAAETTIVTAGAAGIFNDLVRLVISNETATAVVATVRDATAGGTPWKVALAANGGVVIPFETPLPQGTAANNWTVTLSNATTTVDIMAQFVKNK